MPVMDGFDATRAIRARERTTGGAARLPILALTANVEKGVRESCAACGMDGYLSKPFSQAQLQAAITPWLVAAPPPGPAFPSEERAPPDVAETMPETLDRAALDAIRRLQQPGQPDPLRIVFDLYRDSATSLMERIRLALDAGDAEELRRAAHSLKSSSANLGGQRFGTLCHELEALGRDGRMTVAADRFAIAEGEFGQLVEAIETFMQPLRGEEERDARVDRRG